MIGGGGGRLFFLIINDFMYMYIHIGVAWSPCRRDEAHPARVASGVCEGWQVDRRRGEPYSLPVPDPLPGRTDSLHRAL